MIFEQQNQYLTKDKVKSDGFKRRLSFFFYFFFFKRIRIKIATFTKIGILQKYIERDKIFRIFKFVHLHDDFNSKIFVKSFR